MRWLLAPIVALVIAANVAVADPRTEAMLLFDQGQKEMKAGQFEKACNSFERSVAIYPDSGTKGSLARCYEKLGRLASAWLLWRQLADLAPSADLRRDASAQAQKLAPKVAHYLLKIASPAPGFTLTINGKPAALTDIPVPIDAGGVIVRAYAPGRMDWSAELTAVDGEQLTIDVPELVVAKKDDPKRIEPPPPPPTKPAFRTGRTQRIVSLTISSVGAIALGTGLVFGDKASRKFKDAKEACGGSIDRCSNVATAQPLVDDARKAGNLSTILVVTGIAAIATGTFTFTIASKPESKIAITPTAGPKAAGVALSSRF